MQYYSLAGAGASVSKGHGSPAISEPMNSKKVKRNQLLRHGQLLQPDFFHKHCLGNHVTAELFSACLQSPWSSAHRTKHQHGGLKGVSDAPGGMHLIDASKDLKS